MNRKIFTLLASALMLFSTVFTVNARIVGGNLAVGDTVRTLPSGLGKGKYHIRIDSIYLAGTTNDWVAVSGNNVSSYFPSGAIVDYMENDTIVLAVKDNGEVVPISISYLRHRGPDNLKYLDLQSTMWCIEVEDPELWGQQPTYHFTNKVFGLDLDFKDGVAYVDNGDVRKGWMYSSSYDNGQLSNSRPIYRFKDAKQYSALLYNFTDKKIYSDEVDIDKFAAGTVPGLLKFTIVEVAPVVLDADAFNTRLGNNVGDEEGATLLFDPQPKPANELYHNFFGDELTAKDAPGINDYLNLYVKSSKNVIYNVVNPGVGAGTEAYNENDRYTNDLSTKYIRILADGKYDENKDNNAYRLVYFPSKDSLVINAYKLAHYPANSDYEAREYMDRRGYIHDTGTHPYYYGLYTDEINNALIVRLQDINGVTGESIITIGKYPANVRITFGDQDCTVKEVGWQPDEGVYTIWDDKGRCLGVRIYNGSLAPQWIELDEGECPDRIPSYQWVVEKSTKASSRVNITNREFGDVQENKDAHNGLVRMLNVLILKDKKSQIFRWTNIFAYEALRINGGYYQPIQYANVVGKYINPVGVLECVVKTSESGFRPVTKEYLADQYLGYKHFYVDRDPESLSYGKSETVSPDDASKIAEYGMDYSGFAFNYLHSYSENGYVSKREENGDIVLNVSTDEKKKEAFQFHLGKEFNIGNRHYAPEQYGYPVVKIDEPKKYTINLGGDISYEQTAPRLERYYYQLKIADFYEYRDLLAEQYVVLKGAVNTGDRIDVSNKLSYGLSPTKAGIAPLHYMNIYLRESLFLKRDDVKPNEERHIQDPTRRIYYAVLDRIDWDKRDLVGDLGAEVSDQIASWYPDEEASSKFGFVVWRVHDSHDIIKAQGKTISSTRVSTFALENVNYPLYRRLCSIEDDGANAEDGFDAPKTLRIYTQLENRQYLYEDALSADADNFGINFLGYENIDQHPEEQLSDGRYKFNYNLFIDTAFINRGTGWIKPQYLIAVDVEEVGERTVQRTDDCDEPYDEKIPAYKKGRYLINATDSARKIASNGSHTYEIRDERYITSSSWDRLAFVDAIHVDDRLYIVSELQRRGIKEADYMEEEDGKLYVNGLKLREKTVGMARTPQNSGVYGAYYDFAEWNNYHNDVSFSLRFVDPKAANASEKTGLGGTDNDSKRFLIESETTNRNPYGGRKIAPVQGGWVRLVNLVPALSRSSYEDAIQQADIFNVEPGTGKATDNEAVSTVSPVKIIAGTNEVTVLNASGKKLSIENILGQTVNTITLSSDNQTVKAPAGVVVVTVEGEKSAKLFVK